MNPYCVLIVLSKMISKHWEIGLTKNIIEIASTFWPYISNPQMSPKWVLTALSMRPKLKVKTYTMNEKSFWVTKIISDPKAAVERHKTTSNPCLSDLKWSIAPERINPPRTAPTPWQDIAVIATQYYSADEVPTGNDYEIIFTKSPLKIASMRP
jgi:hypothetical protein